MGLPGLMSGREPVGLRVTDDDRLFLASWSSLADAPTIYLQRRNIGPDGHPRMTRGRLHTPNTDRSKETTYDNLGNGWLQSIVPVIASGSSNRGTLFVRVGIVNDGDAPSQVGAYLFQGYLVTGEAAPFWTMGLATDQPMSDWDAAAIVDVEIADPAAGASPVVSTVPDNAIRLLESLYLQWAADANAGARRIILHLDDGSNGEVYFAREEPDSAFIESETWKFLFARGMGERLNPTLATITAALPDHLLLIAGDRVRLVGGNIKATDAITQTRLRFREWLTE